MLLVLGAATLFYLHYTTFLFLVAELACWLVLHRLRGLAIAYTRRDLAIDLFAIILLSLPAVPHLYLIARHRANWTDMASLWSPSLQSASELYIVGPFVALFVATWFRATRRPAPSTRLPRYWTIFWWSVPLSIAWLSTAAGIAPLWLLRYVVIVLVGMIIFAAMTIELFRNTRVSYLVGVLLLFFSVAGSGMVQQWQVDHRLIGDRVENWAEAAAYLNRMNRFQRRPVFLMAELIEDFQLVPGAPKALRAYCKFPFSGIYRLRSAILIPLPSHGAVELTQSQLHMVGRSHGCWLVVRTGKQSAERHARQLIRWLQGHGLTLRINTVRTFGRLTVLQLQCSDSGKATHSDQS